MRRSILLVLLAGAVAFSGCDAFRKLAGRPTAAEIEAKQVALLQARQAREQARLDSLERLRQAAADSLAALDSLKQLSGTILNPSAMGGLYTTKLDSRYYIVVGAFTVRSNAEKLLGRVQKAGYVATLICFRNGYHAVGLCQTDNLNQALRSLKKIKGEPFCPADVWILVNE